MTQELNLHVIRGCTLVSPEIFSINEPVPANITYEQLEAGIADGTYTLKSLGDNTYLGLVRERPNTPLLAQLNITITDDRLVFSIPASVTSTWPNKQTTLFYDLFATDINTDVVTPVVHGKILVHAAITSEV